MLIYVRQDYSYQRALFASWLCHLKFTYLALREVSIEKMSLIGPAGGGRMFTVPPTLESAAARADPPSCCDSGHLGGKNFVCFTIHILRVVFNLHRFTMMVLSVDIFLSSSSVPEFLCRCIYSFFSVSTIDCCL
jgi:hypothetical protein